MRNVEELFNGDYSMLIERLEVLVAYSNLEDDELWSLEINLNNILLLSSHIKESDKEKLRVDNLLLGFIRDYVINEKGGILNDL